MLQVRKEQMEALSAYMRESFQERMTRRIASSYPKNYKTMGDEGTLKLIERGIQKCAGHQIKAERDVAAFIELMVEFGENFEGHRDRASWAPALLKNPKLSGQAKVDVLYVKVAGRVRDN